MSDNTVLSYTTLDKYAE